MVFDSSLLENCMLLNLNLIISGVHRVTWRNTLVPGPGDLGIFLKKQKSDICTVFCCLYIGCLIGGILSDNVENEFLTFLVQELSPPIIFRACQTSFKKQKWKTMNLETSPGKISLIYKLQQLPHLANIYIKCWNPLNWHWLSSTKACWGNLD